MGFLWLPHCRFRDFHLIVLVHLAVRMANFSNCSKLSMTQYSLQPECPMIFRESPLLHWQYPMRYSQLSGLQIVEPFVESKGTKDSDLQIPRSWTDWQLDERHLKQNPWLLGELIVQQVSEQPAKLLVWLLIGLLVVRLAERLVGQLGEQRSEQLF